MQRRKSKSGRLKKAILAAAAILTITALLQEKQTETHTIYKLRLYEHQEEPQEASEENPTSMLTKEEPPPIYTTEDLYLLASIVYAEAGSEWLTDEHQKMVATVVLNRVDSPEFPDTIKEVIYQPGQYGMATRGTLDTIEPDDRAIENAKKVLEGERNLPRTVIFQSTTKQGKIYTKITDETLGTTTYFCLTKYPELYQEETE